MVDSMEIEEYLKYIGKIVVKVIICLSLLFLVLEYAFVLAKLIDITLYYLRHIMIIH